MTTKNSRRNWKLEDPVLHRTTIGTARNYMVTDRDGFFSARCTVYYRGLGLEAARRVVGRRKHLCIREDAGDFWFDPEQTEFAITRGKQPRGTSFTEGEIKGHPTVAASVTRS